MAIALSLIVEIFDLLQRGVNWLGGVSSAEAALADTRGMRPSPSASGQRNQGSSQSAAQGVSQPSHAQQPSQGQPQRLWGGPLRIHPTRRAARMRSSRSVAHGSRW